MMKNFEEKIDQWSDKCKNAIDMKHTHMSNQLSNAIKQLNIDQSIEQLLKNLLQIPNNIQIKHVESLEQLFEQIQKTIQDQEMISFIQVNEDG